MRKIDYPKDLRGFKNEYLAIFDIVNLQRRWSDIRNSIPLLSHHFPKKITRILTGDYHKLTAYYKIFVSHNFSKDEFSSLKDSLKEIFNYDFIDQGKMQPAIASFFMKKASVLNISTCYYCETSYINVYSISSEDDGIYFINHASKKVLSDKIKINRDSSLNKIIARRPFRSAHEFNQYGTTNGLWKIADKFQKSFPTKGDLNHFELDHVLNKGKCPLVALSLMNFVPSCTICNEKLKHSKIIGDYVNNNPIKCLSPTYHKFDFDGNVTISIKPSTGSPSYDPAYALDNISQYSLDFEIKDTNYEYFVKLFRLRERYKFHKAEGLYWLSMKSKYTDSAIEMMADSLNDPKFTKDRIKEDIFREHYDSIRKPCFEKMKRDMLK